ncbi:hypothetical protein [Sphingomonas koreensis]
MTDANNQANIDSLPTVDVPLTPLGPIPEGRRRQVREVNKRIENVHRLYMTLGDEVRDAQQRNLTPNVHQTINKLNRANASLSEAIARFNAALRGEPYRSDERTLPRLSTETKRRWASYFAEEDGEILSLAAGIGAIAARLPADADRNETAIRGDLERMETHGLLVRTHVEAVGHDLYRLTSAGWDFVDRHGRRRGRFWRWLQQTFAKLWVQLLAAASILANFLQIGDAALSYFGLKP